MILNEFVWIWLPSLLVIFAPRLRKYIITMRAERRVDSPDAVADLAADLNASSATD